MAEYTGLFSVEEKEAEGQPHCSLCLPERGSGEKGDNFFFLVPVAGNVGMAQRYIHQGRVGLDMRKLLFTSGDQTQEHWIWNPNIPGEVVNAPSLSVLKRYLDKNLKLCFNFWSAQKWSSCWGQRSL